MQKFKGDFNQLRIKAVISYNGAFFYGFQAQPNRSNTILETLSKAAKRLGIDSKIIGSGRTDRGVHATGQVIHFDLPFHWQKNLKKLKSVYNQLIYPHIYIKTITPVYNDFHARFDAKRRIYRYVYKLTPPTPFENMYVSYVKNINPQKLKIALKKFEGEHDFKYFHKKGSQPTTTIRTIFKTDVKVYSKYVILYLEADGFLRSQVRMIVAAATGYMNNTLTLKQIEEQLLGNVVHTTTLAPPNGLYLARVIYG